MLGATTAGRSPRQSSTSESRSRMPASALRPPSGWSTSGSTAGSKNLPGGATTELAAPAGRFFQQYRFRLLLLVLDFAVDGEPTGHRLHVGPTSVRGRSGGG